MVLPIAFVLIVYTLTILVFFQDNWVLSYHVSSSLGLFALMYQYYFMFSATYKTLDRQHSTIQTDACILLDVCNYVKYS